MRHARLAALALFSAACAGPTSAPSAPRFAVANVEGAAAIFSADDEFMAVLTPADISIRVRGPDATLARLRQIYAEAARPWSEAERARLEAMFARHEASLARLAHLLPPRVLLMKSSGAADTALPHTRGAAINMGPALPREDSDLDNLFFHELFHVLSRHNSARHDEMYALVGFEPCAEALPETLRARTITNPDAPWCAMPRPLAPTGGWLRRCCSPSPRPTIPRVPILTIISTSNSW